MRIVIFGRTGTRRSALRPLLARHGHDVIAETAQAASALVLARRADAVVVDLDLPGDDPSR